MNKRLHKKKRVGEFKALGLEPRGDLRPGISGEEALDEITGEVEVVVRPIEPKHVESAQDVFEFIRSLPPGTRSKEDIDRQIAEERASRGEE
ncbi:MAG: hypothetical protein KF915_16630 [Polyangiaceae bacterium]|nr:hypothetical protein [Polyangiaceae bacterium]